MLRKSWITVTMLTILLAGCQQSTGSSGGVSTPQDTKTPEPTTAASTPTPSVKPAESPAATQAAQEPSQGQKQEATGKVTALRLADAQHGWSGGENWVARTDDGGVHWQVQWKSPGEVKQIFALNDQEAWVTLAETGALFSTTDGGKHWKEAGAVPNQGFLHFVSKKEAYSANAKSVDGGMRWSQLPVPDSIVGDAYFHDKDNGWAVQQKGQNVLVMRTQNGGSTWKQVMSKETVEPVNGAVIRSAGKDDAWIELIGGTGMTQTSYSLFHTEDGGKSWKTVLAQSSAGGGPAPGFPLNYTDGPVNGGSKPGTLYVASPSVAFMAGECPACDEDKQNTIGWTKDGGKTWTIGKSAFGGNTGLLLAMADAKQGWLISTDNGKPSVMYTTNDGGVNWKQVHTFPFDVKK
ncbi:WD40/YVTN/BNR-like repeat-containing protein [Paenibacillus hexagrammi]|uniref:YCF48-related protein n=1 Tax=Paenibacillus hexagrammi TaxID=2908839 RepID=A0ABY3SJI0_9BACL|nr:YCF48-related protein [Paenibacillus sp. YPD9-1]UJF34207.1 YCF48-related protein [Paenibacillus sp. YPD9-1]